MALHALMLPPGNATYNDETNEVTLVFYVVPPPAQGAEITHHVSVTIPNAEHYALADIPNGIEPPADETDEG